MIPAPIPVPKFCTSPLSHTAMSTSTIRIAVVGTGLIGKRHILHIVSEPLTTLVAIIEPHPSGKELAAEHGIPCYDSVAALIAARDADTVLVDAAIVGTPTHTSVFLTT